MVPSCWYWIKFKSGNYNTVSQQYIFALEFIILLPFAGWNKFSPTWHFIIACINLYINLRQFRILLYTLFVFLYCLVFFSAHLVPLFKHTNITHPIEMFTYFLSKTLYFLHKNNSLCLVFEERIHLLPAEVIALIFFQSLFFTLSSSTDSIINYFFKWTLQLPKRMQFQALLTVYMKSLSVILIIIPF